MKILAFLLTILIVAAVAQRRSGSRCGGTTLTPPGGDAEVLPGNQIDVRNQRTQQNSRRDSELTFSPVG